MPDLSAVTDRVKSIPPLVWVVGIGVVIAFVVLKGGGSGGSAPSVSGDASGSGGGGGGDVGTPIDQQVVDLADQIAQQNTDLAAWKKGIEDEVKKGAPTKAVTETVAARVKRLSTEVVKLRKAHPVAAKAWRAKHPIPKTETIVQRAARLTAEVKYLRTAKH